MSQITDEMVIAAVEAAWPGEEIIFSEEFDGPEEMMRAALTAAIASLSHTMGVKGLECHCTKIEQDETCPVGYPSLLCDDCDGKGIRSALTPTQQPVGYFVGEITYNCFYTSKKIAEEVANELYPKPIIPVYASPQAVPGLEKEREVLHKALTLAEGRIALLLEAYPDESEGCDHPTATRYVLSEVRAALKAEVRK